jgi:hypothetical protein
MDGSLQLKQRDYSLAELAAFRYAMGEAGRVLAAADVSRGPWFGFNGVQTLIVTPSTLFVIHAGRTFIRCRVRHRLSLNEVALVDCRVTRSRLWPSVRLVLELRGRQISYVSRYREALVMAEVLTDLKT